LTADGDCVRDEDNEVVSVLVTGRAAPQQVEVYEQTHNGVNWETIPGAAWNMDIRPGETFRQACLRNGGEFAGHGTFRLVVFADPGNPADLSLLHAEEFEEAEFAAA
jgi:hypothetical protein